MTEPKKFKKGKHSYTRWGNFREVRVESAAKKDPASEQQVPVEMDSQVESGIYSNLTVVHQSPDEVVLDFCFQSPERKNPKVRSRVILSPGHAARLAKALKV